MMRFAPLLIAGLLLSGCFRTHYVNFSPHNPTQASIEAPGEPARGAWRHFFIWGWVPNEMPIDARAACGGAYNIDSIETRQTFLEGLVEAFAGYYIVYSPYNGAIYCKPARPGDPSPPDAGAPSGSGAS